MARPAARSMITVTLLLLLLLPGPAAPAPTVVGVGEFGLPKKKVGDIVIRDVATAGVTALVKALGGSSKGGQLGRDAADNAGIILYNVSVGQQTFSGRVDIFRDFFWVKCPDAPAQAFAAVPCASPTCSEALNTTAETCGERADCDYVYGSNNNGYLANEKITVGVETGKGKPISGKVVFGCSTNTSAKLDGAIGLSKGSLSILSQLNISRFPLYSHHKN